MSNVLKGYYVSVDEESRVVEVDELLQLRMQEEEERKARLQYIFGNSDNEDEEGFVEGLPVQNIDALLSDESGEGTLGESDSIIPNADEEALNSIRLQIEEANNELEAINLQIQSAMEEAQASIENMKQEAYENAKAEGYNAGYSEGLSNVESMKAELLDKEAQLNLEYEKNLMELEPQLVDAITDIYEHIFNVELKSYRSLVTSLIIDTINDSKATKNIFIHLSREDYPDILTKKEEILAEIGMRDENVEFIQDATLGESQCMIETENGVFDCSLSTELCELKRKLMLLAYRK